MDLTNLRKVYEQYCSGDEPTDTEALGFLRNIAVISDNKLNDIRDFDHVRSVLSLAGRCQEIFKLRHFGRPEIFLFGVILGARVFGPNQPAPIFAGGRGTTPRDAFIGCIDELAERLASRVWCPSRAPDNLKSIVDLFPDWSRSMNIDVRNENPGNVTGKDLQTGDLVSFPWHGRSGLFGSSAGCAVASDLPTANQRAAYELIERDAVARWWFGQKTVPPPPSECQNALDGVFVPGTGRRRWLLDLSTENNVPVIAAISTSRAGRGMILGAAAGSNYLSVATRASLELCQMEAAAHLASEKRKTLGVGSLTDVDRLWIQRLETSLPFHVHPDDAQRGPVQSIPPNVEPTQLIGSCYAFDMSIPEYAFRISRVIAPNLCTMTSPHGLEKEFHSEVQDRNQREFADYPSPI